MTPPGPRSGAWSCVTPALCGGRGWARPCGPTRVPGKCPLPSGRPARAEPGRAVPGRAVCAPPRRRCRGSGFPALAAAGPVCGRGGAAAAVPAPGPGGCGRADGAAGSPLPPCMGGGRLPLASPRLASPAGERGVSAGLGGCGRRGGGQLPPVSAPLAAPRSSPGPGLCARGGAADRSRSRGGGSGVCGSEPCGAGPVSEAGSVGMGQCRAGRVCAVRVGSVGWVSVRCGSGLCPRCRVSAREPRARCRGRSGRCGAVRGGSERGAGEALRSHGRLRVTGEEGEAERASARLVSPHACLCE